MKLILIVY